MATVTVTIQGEELIMKNSKLNILLSKCNAKAPIPDDLTAWLDSPSVGNEVIAYCEETSLSSEDEYRAALKIIEGLFDAIANTAEGAELEKWVSLVESYENEHFPM
jgi:HTH-type transcriptional regulator/antitoxin HigA